MYEENAIIVAKNNYYVCLSFIIAFDIVLCSTQTRYAIDDRTHAIVTLRIYTNALRRTNIRVELIEIYHVHAIYQHE
jgi:hypothetical protein